jgi:hypothetical protein
MSEPRESEGEDARAAVTRPRTQGYYSPAASTLPDPKQVQRLNAIASAQARARDLAKSYRESGANPVDDLASVSGLTDAQWAAIHQDSDESKAS